MEFVDYGKNGLIEPNKTPILAYSMPKPNSATLSSFLPPRVKYQVILISLPKCYVRLFFSSRYVSDR